MFREDNINIDWRKLPQARGLTSDNTMLSDRGRRQAKECAARTEPVTICRPELTCESVDLIDWTRQGSFANVAAVAGSQHNLERPTSWLKNVSPLDPFENGASVAFVPAGVPYWDFHDEKVQDMLLSLTYETRFRNVNITNVFASPFDRTIQTASIIADEKNLLVKPEPGLCEALHHCCDPPGFWTPEKLKEKYPLVDAKYIPAFPRTSLPKQEFGDNECKPRIRVTLNRLTEKYDGTMDS
ncbi:hypothetical protein Y032_0112g275 [Ancylostoma ceylanicum]|uniref:Uncharacterized protein n=1 Tax=Ancylostoma ceylanicum TaxID=53326 RepID=A0A016TDX2_9BILA|nr:hypothetical protein Y032_0112g275 [Ancylostoma ceylanicum]